MVKIKMVQSVGMTGQGDFLVGQEYDVDAQVARSLAPFSVSVESAKADKVEDKDLYETKVMKPRGKLSNKNK